MKKKISLTLILAALVVLAALIGALSVSATTLPKLSGGENASIAVGASKTVNFALSDLDPSVKVEGVTVTVRWDPAVLQGSDAAFGEIVSAAYKQVGTYGDLASDYVAGRVIFAAMDLDSALSSYTGTLVSMTFTGIADGSSAVTIEVSSFGTETSDLSGSFVITSPTITVASNNVVYISDSGTGDGSSPDNPLGNGQAYADALSTKTAAAGCHQQSAYYKAIQQLASTGGTIVLVGETSFFGGTGVDHYMPANSKPITVTSVYDSVDYREAPFNAEFVMTSFNNQNNRMHFTGDMVWENLTVTIDRDYDKSLCFAFRGYQVTFGEGIVMKSRKDGVYDASVTAARLPTVYGGNMWNGTAVKSGRDDAVDFRLLSGSYYKVVGVGQFPNSGADVTGDVNMFLGACTVRNNVMGFFQTSPNGSTCRLTGNINITFAGTRVEGSVYGTTEYVSTGTTAANVSGYAVLDGNLNITINDGTYLSTVYATPTGAKDSSDAVVNYGQITGNAVFTVNATGTNRVEFFRFDLGAQGFTSASSVWTVRFNGDNWYSRSNTLNTSANTFVFAGSGSNFVASGGYRYLVLDFSGMTYNEFWNHTNRDDVPVYHGFRYYTGRGVVPTVQPDGLNLSYYGYGTAAYGASEVIEPVDVVTSISYDGDPVAYYAGSVFDPDGLEITVVRQSGSYDCTIGGDFLKEDFTWSGSALSVNDTARAVTLTAVSNPLGSAVDFTVPLTVTAMPVYLSKIEISTQPDKTVYAVGETFDPAGLVVAATYSNNAVSAVPLGAIAGLPGLLSPEAIGGTVGEKTFVISYTEGDLTKTADLILTVKDSISGIVFENVPSAVINDTNVDFSGMTVRVIYAVAGEITVSPDDIVFGGYNNTIFNPELRNRRLEVEATYVDPSDPEISATRNLYVPVLTDLNVVGRTVYVSETGTGDGSSASSPVGYDARYPVGIWVDTEGAFNAEEYLYDENDEPVPSAAFQGSPLYRAIYALGPEGGKIVIVDSASFGVAGEGIADEFIVGNTDGNVVLPSWTGTIEITGQTASSEFLVWGFLNNPRVHFNGPIDLHGVRIAVCYTEYSTLRPNFALGGFSSVVDASAGMSKRRYPIANGAVSYATYTSPSEIAHTPQICCGVMQGSTVAADQRVDFVGGTWHQIDIAGNVGSAVIPTFSGNVTVSLTGVNLTSNFYGSRPNSGVLRFARFTDNVTLVINEGCVFGGYVYFAYQRFADFDSTYRVIMNAIPTFSTSGRYFYTNAGGAVTGWLDYSILDFSGMDYTTFYANKSALNNLFYRYDSTVVDEDGDAYGRGANTNYGFKTVVAPTGISYVGTSIRVTGNMGIRFKFTLDNALKTKPDFTFGVLLGKASNFENTPLEAGAEKSVAAELVKTDGEGNLTLDRWFKQGAKETTYVVVLMAKDGRWTDERRFTEYLVRPYCVVDGMTLYGNFLGTSGVSGEVNYNNETAGLARSIRYVAKLAQDYYSTTAYAAAVNALAAD